MADRFYQPGEVHLKPMHLASSTSVNSGYTNNSYNPLPYGSVQTNELLQLETDDHRLKQRIRILKVISRVLALLLSAATLVPLIMTIVKFMQTKDTYFEVDGHQRTAWAQGTKTWYTYMYAGISGVSLILNFVVVMSYCRGIKQANRASTVSGWWSWVILIAHVVVWAVSAGIYRYGKVPDKDGKFKDLWGWTCSNAADELQAVLTNVDFKKYCGIQTTSFYTGVANVAAGILSLAIFVMAMMRRKSKKNIKRATFQGGDLEPLRMAS